MITMLLTMVFGFAGETVTVDIATDYHLASDFDLERPFEREDTVVGAHMMDGGGALRCSAFVDALERANSRSSVAWRRRVLVVADADRPFECSPFDWYWLFDSAARGDIRIDALMIGGSDPAFEDLAAITGGKATTANREKIATALHDWAFLL